MARSDFRFYHARRTRMAGIDAPGIMFNSRTLEHLTVGARECARATGLRPGCGEDRRCDGESALVRSAGPGQVAGSVPVEAIALFEAHEGRSLRA